MKTKKNRFIEKGKKVSHSKIYHYEVIILGGGPAGLTAAIYSARYGMKTGLITRDIGGMANLARRIENYPGYEGSGFELMQKFYKQAKNYGTEFLNDDVVSLEKDSNGFIVRTTDKLVHTKSIIIALGTERKKLNIKGEDKFVGRGVSYCASCDGAFFKDKNVAVIGGSDAACMDALILSGLAKKVYVIVRSKLRCEEIVARKLRMKKNVKFIFKAVPIEIQGKDVVSEIIIEREGKKREIKIDGIFIEAGSLPLSDIAKILKIEIDEEGYVKVDNEMKTNISGVFAAGDVVKSKLKQVVIAAGQGAKAAKSAYDFIESLK